MTGYTGRSRVCLRFGFAKPNVMRVPSDRGYASLHLTRHITPFGRTCQVGTSRMLMGSVRARHPVDQPSPSSSFSIRPAKLLERGGALGPQREHDMKGVASLTSAPNAAPGF